MVLRRCSQTTISTVIVCVCLLLVRRPTPNVGQQYLCVFCNNGYIVVFVLQFSTQMHWFRIYLFHLLCRLQLPMLSSMLSLKSKNRREAYSNVSWHDFVVYMACFYERFGVGFLCVWTKAKHSITIDWLSLGAMYLNVVHIEQRPYIFRYKNQIYHALWKTASVTLHCVNPFYVCFNNSWTNPRSHGYKSTFYVWLWFMIRHVTPFGCPLPPTAVTRFDHQFVCLPSLSLRHRRANTPSGCCRHNSCGRHRSSALGRFLCLENFTYFT